MIFCYFVRINSPGIETLGQKQHIEGGWCTLPTLPPPKAVEITFLSTVTKGAHHTSLLPMLCCVVIYLFFVCFVCYLSTGLQS